MELNDQIEQLDQANDKLRQRVNELESSHTKMAQDTEAAMKELASSEQVYKKEIQTLKYENKRQGFDLKDVKDRLEKTKTEYDVQF